MFGYGDRKQAHKELSEAFALLVGTIRKAGDTQFTEQQLCAWQADLQQLNAKEPPALHTLVTLCQNEVANAMNEKSSIVHVNFCKRVLADWFSFS